jgi:CMP-N-acetylneuraminic acid synthetase
MKYLLVVPARGGSKGLPGKNIYPLFGVPLILWTIKSAIESQVGDIVVTTDGEDIKKVVSEYNGKNVSIIDRPHFYASDEIPLAPTIIHAYETLTEFHEGVFRSSYDVVITLQPTSPFRNAQDIKNAVKIFEETKCDSLLSVIEDHHSVWERSPWGTVVPVRERQSNRQYERPMYIANGAIFITKRDTLLKQRNRIGGKVEVYVMPFDRSFDIHTKEDIELAECLKKRGEA